MLDVLKDTGFDGLRFVGWPEALDRYGSRFRFGPRAVSARLRLLTLSFYGDAHNPERHAPIDKAPTAPANLRHFGATEMVVFSPKRPNKVVREYLRVACDRRCP